MTGSTHLAYLGTGAVRGRREEVVWVSGSRRTKSIGLSETVAGGGRRGSRRRRATTGVGTRYRGGKLTKVSLGLDLGVHLRVGGALARGDSLGPGLLHRLGSALVEDVGHQHRAGKHERREHHAHRREGDEEGPCQENRPGRLPGVHNGEVVGVVPGVTGDRRRHRARSPAQMRVGVLPLD